jgi:hypothetical protein
MSKSNPSARERFILSVEGGGLEMPYCARCLIEYVEGTSQCEDCGAFLLPGSPPEAPPKAEIQHEKDVKLVPVRSYSGPSAQMDADIARGVLQSQSIPCALSGEGAGEPFPLMEVHVLVREEDKERAARVLEAYLEAETPVIADETDPAEGA